MNTPYRVGLITGVLLMVTLMTTLGIGGRDTVHPITPEPTPDIIPTPYPIELTVRERYGGATDPTPTPTDDDAFRDDIYDDVVRGDVDAAAPARTDACEPNNSLTEPCAIPANTTITDLTFADDDIDVYSVFLKASRTISVAVDVTEGIDPVLTVYRAEDTETVIAENDDVSVDDSSAHVAFPVETDGWYVLHVRNRASGTMDAYTYSITVQSGELPATRPETVSVDETVAIDMFEPNHTPDLAQLLGWGVPYQFSLQCPVPSDVNIDEACPAGDHDFFRVQTTAGVALTLVTHSLSAGLNTVLTVYKPDVTQTVTEAGSIAGWVALHSNDDVAPGWTPRSQIVFTPDWTGEALIVVANASRTNPAVVPDDEATPGRYGLMVAPENYQAMRELQSTFDDLPPTVEPDPAVPSGSQTGNGDSASPETVDTGGVSDTNIVTTTPTPAPTGIPQDYTVNEGAVTDPREVISEQCMTGLGEVSNVDGAMLWAAKNPVRGQDEVVLLPHESQVYLLGECEGRWLKVAPTQSASLGWVFHPDIVPLDGSAPWTRGEYGDEWTDPSPDTDDPFIDGQDPITSTETLDEPSIEPLGAAPVPTSQPLEHQFQAAYVRVCAVVEGNANACPQPLAGVRVNVLHGATQAQLGTGSTDPDGYVRISLSVLPSTAFVLEIPTYDVEQVVEEFPAHDTPIIVQLLTREDSL